MSAGFALPGVCTLHRLICEGDENALTPEETRDFAGSILKVRRASGAARIVARNLLAGLGVSNAALPKSASGAPIWPAEVVGSLAHDEEVAVAAVGMRCEVGAIGIDVEPAEELPSDLMDVVATPSERTLIANFRLGGRLLFAAKEAVYKAVYPLDQQFLEHHDVEIDFTSRKATVRDGRTVDLRFVISTHLVVLAFISALTTTRFGRIERL